MNFIDYYRIFSERAYHGSAKKIKGTFSYNKIGSGQGAQMFGYGFYFSSSQTVANSYVQGSCKKSYRYKGRDANFWYDLFANKRDYNKAQIWESIMLHARRDYIFGLLKEMEANEEDFEYLKSLPSRLFAPDAGSLYEVEINASKDELLKWDNYFEQQSDFVKTKLRSIQDRVLEGAKTLSFFKDNKELDKIEGLDGMNIYQSLSKNLEDTEFSQFSRDDQKASLFLNSIGIKGVSYPEDNGRHENYVIFSPDNIKIIKQVD